MFHVAFIQDLEIILIELNRINVPGKFSCRCRCVMMCICIDMCQRQLVASSEPTTPLAIHNNSYKSCLCKIQTAQNVSKSIQKCRNTINTMTHHCTTLPKPMTFRWFCSKGVVSRHPKFIAKSPQSPAMSWGFQQASEEPRNLVKLDKNDYSTKTY